MNQTFKPLLPPYCKPNMTCSTYLNLSCMAESYTQTKIDTQGYIHMELKVAMISTPNCVADNALWNGMVQLRCDFHGIDFGQIRVSLTSYNERPVDGHWPIQQPYRPGIEHFSFSVIGRLILLTGRCYLSSTQRTRLQLRLR